MNMTDRFNPANENDPKRKLAYGLIALACVIALGFGLDAASCSRTGSVVFKSSTPCCAHADKSPLTGMLHPRSDAISL